MKPIIAALVVGWIATALPIGAVSEANAQGVVAAPAPTAPSPAPSPDSWRYRFYNGSWWYWTPDNRWLCYINGQWVIPAAPVQAGVPVYPQYYTVVPQPYYGPYPYGYYNPYPCYGGGISIGFGGGWGGGWHGGYGGHR
jgi:hypothetical protein